MLSSAKFCSNGPIGLSASTPPGPNHPIQLRDYCVRQRLCAQGIVRNRITLPFIYLASMLRFLHASVLCLVCGLAIFAQDNPAQSPPAQPAETLPQQAGTSSIPTQQAPPVEDKRVFGVIPNNRTTEASIPFKRISAGHKMVIALKDSFDWPIYITGGLFAGLYQLDDSSPSFGQGTAGYFRRFGTALADQVIGNMMTEGIVPAIGHQDPRYFRLGRGGGTKKHRLVYAVESIMVARMDSGHKSFNFSEWGGNSMAVAISNAYYPDTRTAADNAQKLLIACGTDAFSNVLKEFWPDVKDWLHKHKNEPATAAPATVGAVH